MNVEKRMIETIAGLGYEVLEVKLVGGEILTFVVYRWSPSYFSSAESVDYNVLEGVDITDFVVKNINEYNNPRGVDTGLMKWLDDNPPVRLTFDKSCSWALWSGAVSTFGNNKKR